MRMTEEMLAEIEARAAAATPGPWQHRHGFIETVEEPHHLLGVTMHRSEKGLPPLPGASNAEFMAAARDDVPRLIHEVRTLLADIDRLESLVNQRAVGG